MNSIKYISIIVLLYYCNICIVLLYSVPELNEIESWNSWKPWKSITISLGQWLTWQKDQYLKRVTAGALCGVVCSFRLLIIVLFLPFFAFFQLLYYYIILLSFTWNVLRWPLRLTGYIHLLTHPFIINILFSCNILAVFLMDSKYFNMAMWSNALNHHGCIDVRQMFSMKFCFVIYGRWGWGSRVIKRMGKKKNGKKEEWKKGRMGKRRKISGVLLVKCFWLR